MIVENDLFSSEWFVEMPLDDRYFFLYLLSVADRKVGAFEWNQRMHAFCANVGKTYTADDVVRIYGGRIVKIEGRNHMIFVDYIHHNWTHGTRPLNPKHNPIDRAIVKSLGRYGISVDWLNARSKHRIEVVGECPAPVDNSEPAEVACEHETESAPEVEPKVERVLARDVATMFDRFWAAYPSCSRKVNRKVCAAKFARIVGTNPDGAVAKFNEVMGGLEKWTRSKDWAKDGGAYICAPLVWLNQERWTANVDADPFAAPVKPKEIVVKEGDWCLCEERCAAFANGCCSCGFKIPPQLRPHPMPPEECQEFAPREDET